MLLSVHVAIGWFHEFSYLCMLLVDGPMSFVPLHVAVDGSMSFLICVCC